MKSYANTLLGVALLTVAATATLAARAAAAPAAISFNRDIRPILSDHCSACHGPDQKKRKGKLRLDTKEGLFAQRDDHTTVVPGKRSGSELFRRVTTANAEDHMPPQEFGKPLSKTQIDLLGRWIDEGASWQGHWAFLKPERPALPAVHNAAWPRHEIDYFILSKLESSNLQPSPPAAPEKLIRRVSFDLTGLPPTPEEVEACLADTAPDAYEKLVDRLLNSPRYGERMGLHWLDLARYADTHGYHLDSGRDMWKWREWVIEAFNRNQPYDQFALEQIAGDLLPGASLSQKLATGFNRNTMINFEGGAIPEEYLTQYIIDRVNTTSTVFLGLTMACAQCHDHKFDPLTQKDFYRFYAYFNAVPENGLDGRSGNAAPLVYVPSPAQQSKLEQLQSGVKQLEDTLRAALPRIDAAQKDWESETKARAQIRWKVLDPIESKSLRGATLTKLDDHSILASGGHPESDIYEFTAQTDDTGLTAVRLEALNDASLPKRGPGRSSNGNFVLTGFELEAVSVAHPDQKQIIPFSGASANFSQSGFDVALAIDGDAKSGWGVEGAPRGRSPTAWLAAAQPFGFAGGTQLRFRLRFESTFGNHAIGRTRLSISADPEAARSGPMLPPETADVLALAADQRSEVQKEALRKYYRENVSTLYRQDSGEVTRGRRALSDFQKILPTSMVMEQMANPRDTFVLIRGQYNKPGEKVTPGVPASLLPLPPDAPPNRLGLAQWLIDPSHPLMARVTVNRFWAMVMGQGLVKTANDFGAQAEWPTHPELLDWLATEFMSSGWNVKQMMKRLVTSATYRQSSVVSAELAEIDPDNRLYARGPRFRLSAEAIRDNALAVSGLLTRKIGGPSVSPYQPPGLWEELSLRQDSKNWSAQFYVQSQGEDLYRRSMYTFWKRTSPPPSLQAFDAPDRETCTVQRDRTTTPLQALVLLNDPAFVEAARFLAQRILTEAQPSAAERIAFAFRLALARRPSAAEVQILTELEQKQRARFLAHPEAARQLLSVGEGKTASPLDAAELAAWTSVASLILNLDETVTKG